MKHWRLVVGSMGFLAAIVAGRPVWEATVDSHAAEVFVHEPEDTHSIDWAQLLEENPAVVGWLRVDSAEIDLPVVQAGDADPEQYLHENLRNEKSIAGVPFVDHRTTLGSRHVIIYGHHLTGIGGMFSSLRQCYLQEEFDERLSSGLDLYQRDGSIEQYAPLCAIHCDDAYQKIQEFRFGDTSELHKWLESICSDASALAPNWTGLIRGCKKVVTLVTCSSRRAGMPERTAVVFCGA